MTRTRANKILSAIGAALIIFSLTACGAWRSARTTTTCVQSSLSGCAVTGTVNTSTGACKLTGPGAPPAYETDGAGYRYADSEWQIDCALAGAP